jgi:hypothetical protein
MCLSKEQIQDQLNMDRQVTLSQTTWALLPNAICGMQHLRPLLENEQKRENSRIEEDSSID